MQDMLEEKLIHKVKVEKWSLHLQMGAVAKQEMQTSCDSKGETYWKRQELSDCDNSYK
jgi:hypothetical protein